MNSPQCEYCGSVNRATAEVCEACDFPLSEDDPSGGSRWTADELFDRCAPADDIPAPPFKGAGDVISPMLAVYRKHFMLVGILVLASMLPRALLQYGLVDMTMGLARDGVGTPLLGIGLGSLFVWMLSTVASALLSGALVYAIVDLQRAGSSSAGECLARGLKSLPNIFLVTLLFKLITSAGYLLFFVPGIILSLMFAVCIPVAVVEGRGPIEALKRSRRLTDGYKELLLGTYFLWAVLVFVLNWIVKWSFMKGGSLALLPSLLLQTAVLGMVSSSLDVLTVYVYLGLLRERRSGFQTGTFTHSADAAAG